MKTTTHCIKLILICLMLLTVVSAVNAQDTVNPGTQDTESIDSQELPGNQEESDMEESRFDSTVQVDRAENLAEAAAQAASQSLAEAESTLDAAQTAYDAAVQSGTPEAIAEALATLDAAQTAADAAAAVAAGISVPDIADMRDAGMGWGEIAHELGVHPSILGMGFTHRYGKTETVRETAQIADSAQYGNGYGRNSLTDRNVEAGVAVTPGSRGKSNSNGLGLGRTSTTAKNGSSKSSSNGNGNGSGNSAGNSGGNGNGNSGGNGGGNGNGNGKS